MRILHGANSLEEAVQAVSDTRCGVGFTTSLKRVRSTRTNRGELISGALACRHNEELEARASVARHSSGGDSIVEDVGFRTARRDSQPLPLDLGVPENACLGSGFASRICRSDGGRLRRSGRTGPAEDRSLRAFIGARVDIVRTRIGPTRMTSPRTGTRLTIISYGAPIGRTHRHCQ